MRYSNLKFNKDRDICDVVPGLALDISEAISTGRVLGSSEAVFNGIVNVASVGPRIHDEFDSSDYLNRIRSSRNLSTAVQGSSGDVE